MMSSAVAALLLFAASPEPRSASAVAVPSSFAMRECYPGASCSRSASELGSLPDRWAAAAPAAMRTWRPTDATDGQLAEPLVGRVMCLDGPVPGMRIGISPAAHPSRQLATCFSDQQGQFRLFGATLPTPLGSVQRLIACGANGTNLLGPRCPSDPAAPRTIEWQIDAHLIALRIADSAGEPLSHCAVQWHSASGAHCFAVRHRTDAEGACAVLLRGAVSAEVELRLPNGTTHRATFGVGATPHLWVLPTTPG